MTTMENQPTMIMTMGAGGSGKSYVAHREYPEYVICDPDEVMMKLPGYNNEEIEKYHALAAPIHEACYRENIEQGIDFVLDGTGGNAEKMIRRATYAQQNGYRVVLLYVVCPLKKCLERNKQRERHVPEEIIIQKWNEIRYAFDAVAPVVDEVRVIQN